MFTSQVKEGPVWHWLPNAEEIIATFKNWAWVAVASTIGCFVVIYLGLPLVMTSERLSLSGGTKHIDISCTSLKFKLNSIATILRPGVSGWIVFVNISTIVAAAVMIALPFLQEVKSIVQELGRDKSKVCHRSPKGHPKLKSKVHYYLLSST